MSVPKDMPATWHWPEDIDADHKTPLPTEGHSQPSTAEHEKEPNEERLPTLDPEDAVPPRQRHYPPRQCRICLEEVQPTFEPATEGIQSFLNPTPKVRYLSSDPTLGRLFRPCKCRGSQQYVHEGCLQAWRHADPHHGQRNFWECPTCGFKYRMERIRWSKLISSTFVQILITFGIMFLTVFLFGFVADPIINLYLDPYDVVTSGGAHLFQEDNYEDGSWAEHLLKGIASLGLLGFVKVFLLSPWLNLRHMGIMGGRRRGTGRDRLEDISWTVVVIGVITFLAAVWTWVRSWTRNFLETAGERLVDVQGDEDEDVEQPTEFTGAQATT